MFMKKRLLITLVVFLFIFSSFSYAVTGSWEPSFTSSSKTKTLTHVSGLLKKYVSYAKGKVNEGAAPGTFSARFGTAHTAYVTCNWIPTHFTTEPTFNDSTVTLSFYRTELGSTFTGKMVWDLR